ncbi:MAG TPA: hypothetical protein VGR67_14340 [Candidatus Polarisedimenticolia bacterium]|jgi:hypothetical protein|nr:hypothetical protein [Candidatus Polarisedimenticolia bacterium]
MDDVVRGKTHVFRVLHSRLREVARNTVVYLDARTLGSTAQFSDTSLPIGTRCLALFRDVLSELHNELLEHIVDKPTSKANEALEALSKLADAFVQGQTSIPKAITQSEEASSSDASGGKIGVTSAGVMAELKAEGSSQQKTATVTQFAIESDNRILFPNLHNALSNVLKLADTELYLLLDEWSSLPEDVQPYLAEFLKRGVLPVTSAVLKIASLEYRSRFSISDNGRLVGFELGADVSTAADLDDYYVFDRNPDGITSAFADMLYRHLLSELPEGYISKNYKVTSGADLASRLFTERETFKELARAAEGVVRDLINIFTKAFFDSHRRERDSIDRRAIIEAARQWFEQDKAQHLDSQLQGVLQRIVDEVIGKRKARSFLLPRELERHVMVQRLFDARVLHHMQRGYADKDNPGIRYNIYTLDYGTYVDLLNTSKEPEIDLLTGEEGPEFAVPFDDKRSIRRIVLTEDALR